MTIIDQKVREKLANFKLPEDRYASAYPTLGYKWADALLQSPDLRVTLVEKQDFVAEMIKRTRYELCSTAEYKILDILDELNARLNSKEPRS